MGYSQTYLYLKVHVIVKNALTYFLSKISYRVCFLQFQWGKIITSLYLKVNLGENALAYFGRGPADDEKVLKVGHLVAVPANFVGWIRVASYLKKDNFLIRNN